MRSKTAVLLLIFLVIAALAAYVAGQTPADKQEQPKQAKFLPAENPMEDRVHKLENKVADLERRMALIEYKLKP